MSLLSNIAGNVTANQRAIEDALAATGKEIKALENWITQHAASGDDTLSVIVGKQQIESDPLIFEKSSNLIDRLMDITYAKWDDQAGIDLHKAAVNFMVFKYAIAAGMGLKFDQANAQSFPHTAKLASLDYDTLSSYFEEAFEDTQQLYKKYFISQ
ncbi:MAG: hypothetical protein V4611_01440 [Patescibacteria group bacterium]